MQEVAGLPLFLSRSRGDARGNCLNVKRVMAYKDRSGPLLRNRTPLEVALEVERKFRRDPFESTA
jgi:hypothetical protein